MDYLPLFLRLHSRPALAGTHQTAVFYVGVAQLPRSLARLRAAIEAVA